MAANSRIGSSLINQTGAVARLAFESLGSWRDDDYLRFVRQITPILSGAKMQAAQASVAFYKSMANLDDQDWQQPTISAADLTTQALRNGVTTEQVYRRPFVDVYTALSKGKQMTEAIEAGANRVESLASTEIQLARRNVGLKARNANDRIVGYIRTLTGAENCALCYVASTQRYTRGELMPIHPGCDCGEMPLYGTQDPGQIIDEARLEATHDSIAERFGVSARDARSVDYSNIKIEQNGELGPVLTVRGQQFTGPVGANVSPISYLDLTEDQVDKLEKQQASKLILNEAQQSTLIDYKGNEAYLVNDALRSGQYVDDWGEEISSLDKIIELSPPLDRDITVGRYLKGNQSLSNLQVGQSFEDKAFMSTSLNAVEVNKQGWGSSNARMDIEIPKGSRGLFLDGALGELSEIPEEREFLLPRNSRLELLAIQSETKLIGGQNREINVYKFRLVENV